MTKRKGVLRHFFGVSQEEMAMLLKISRAQWSMFESGKLNLPHDAEIEYSEMLTFVQSAKNEAAKNERQPAILSEETTQELKSSLLVNRQRQLITAIKIDRLEKKRTMGEAALHLKGYYENSKEEQPKFVEDLINEILKRARKDIQLGESAEMIELKIKVKLLQYEERLLNNALEEIK